MIHNVWVLPGLRTAFAKSDGALEAMDAIELSVPVAKAMIEQIDSGLPDFAVWGMVLPNATAGWTRGFFDDLVIPIAGVVTDSIPRQDTA